MSYTPTTWTTGDTITASALNKIEQGIADGGGGALIVTVSDSPYTMDKTFAEIYTALADNIPCYMEYRNIIPSDLDSEYTYHITLAPITKAYKYDDAYIVAVSLANVAYLNNTANVTQPLTASFLASQANDYPTFHRKTYVNSASLSLSSAWDL